jgi:hypothetical protein
MAQFTITATVCVRLITPDVAVIVTMYVPARVPFGAASGRLCPEPPPHANIVHVAIRRIARTAGGALLFFGATLGGVLLFEGFTNVQNDINNLNDGAYDQPRNSSGPH